METTSFEIETLVPSVAWQAEKMRLLREADSATQGVVTAEICAAFNSYIHHIARSWWRRYGHIQGKTGLDDIESAGRHGLLVALRRWKPDFGKPFIHFASRWVAETCRTEAARLSQGVCLLPPRLLRLCDQYRRLRQEGSLADLQRLLSDSRTRESTQRVVRFLSQSDTNLDLRLDHSPTDGYDGYGNTGYNNLKSDEVAPRESAELSEVTQTIRDVLLGWQCNARECLVFFLLFPNMPLAAGEVGIVITRSGKAIDPTTLDVKGIDRRLTKIADVLGLTRERVRQINKDVLTKLRTRLSWHRAVDHGQKV